MNIDRPLALQDRRFVSTEIAGKVARMGEDITKPCKARG